MTTSGYVERTIAEDVIWDLGDLYSSPSDPQIDADTKRLREKVSAFSSFRGKVAGLGPEDLLQAVRELEEINELAREAAGIRISEFFDSDIEPGRQRSFSIPQRDLQ